MSPCVIREHGSTSAVLLGTELHSIMVDNPDLGIRQEILVRSTPEGFTLETNSPRFFRTRYALGVEGVARSVSLGNDIVVDVVPEDRALDIRANFQNPKR